MTGYEWAPSGVSVEEAIRRGVEESRREFDSLLPAVLFTHESDHIQHISPSDWDAILSGVMGQLNAEKPVPVTLDFVARYMRALHTSSLQSVRFNRGVGRRHRLFVGVERCAFEVDALPRRQRRSDGIGGSAVCRPLRIEVVSESLPFWAANRRG